MRRTLLAGTGGVVAALLGALCCAGPFVFVALGVGAGLASTFEPLRPVFGVLMVALLGVGFRTVYGTRPLSGGAPVSQGALAHETSCDVPLNRTRDKAILWTAAALALVLWTFPTWSRLFA